MGYLKPFAAGVLLLGSFASAAQAEDWKLPEVAPLIPMEEAPHAPTLPLPSEDDIIIMGLASGIAVAVNDEAGVKTTCYRMPVRKADGTSGGMIQNCRTALQKIEYRI